MEKVIGIYPMGYEKIRLVMEDGTDGWGIQQKSDSDIGEIHIGKDEPEWLGVFRTLAHEAFELTAVKENCHYEHTDDMGDDSGRSIIVMRHDQFASIIGRAADFLLACQDDLFKAWEKDKRSKQKTVRLSILSCKAMKAK